MTDHEIQYVLDLRRKKKLHTVVENRLIELIKAYFPDSKPVSEVSAVLGGRNDLLQYFFDGRKIVFEIFCSSSQVSQDLRLLEQCDANIKIAIILDPDIDESVSIQYFRKKPNAFPFLWLNHVLCKNWEKITIARLHELIDENDSIKKLRRLLSTKYRNDIEDIVGKALDQLETKLPKKKTNTSPYSGKEVLSLLIINKIAGKGIPSNKLRSLYQWLVTSIEYGVMVIQAGFKAYLITDLEGRNAIWSAGDLIDDLIVLDYDTNDKSQVVLCLNQIVNHFFEKSGMKKAEEKFHVFHTYFEFMKEPTVSGDIKNDKVE